MKYHTIIDTKTYHKIFKQNTNVFLLCLEKNKNIKVLHKTIRISINRKNMCNSIIFR